MNKIIKSVLIVFPLLFLITCIERNNPWDPIFGCPEEIKADYRQNQAHQIDTLRSNMLLSSSKIGNLLDTFSINKQDIQRIFDRNDSLKRIIEAKGVFNDSIDNYNNGMNCILLGLKDTYELLDTARLFFTGNIDNILDLSESDSLVSAVARGNKKCEPLGIYTSGQMDTIFAPIKILSIKRDSLIRVKENYSRTFIDTNSSIRKFNENLLQQNRKILSYNDSIQMVKFICQKHPVMNAETLKKRVETIKSGDTLYIGADTFRNTQLDFRDLMDSTRTTVIMGSPFMNTILDSMRIFVSKCYNLKFKNLIIQNSGGRDGPNSGVKLQNNSRSVIFDSCRIINSGLYGIESAGCSMRLNNCTIMNNKEGGVKIDQGQNDAGVSLDGSNVLIANNGKYGIFSIRATITLFFATISDNDSGGVYFNAPQTSSNFYYSIFSFNGGSGVFHDRTENINGIVNFANCDFYQNAEMDINVKDEFVTENIKPMYKDPVFVDKNQNNYRISPSSSIYGPENYGYQYEK